MKPIDRLVFYDVLIHFDQSCIIMRLANLFKTLVFYDVFDAEIILHARITFDVLLESLVFYEYLSFSLQS